MNTNDKGQEILNWDFEKYAAVILYINAYCEHFMSDEQRLELEELYEDTKYGISVTQELLKQMDLDESLDEFCNEALIMQEELNIEEEEHLLELEREDEEVTLYIDPVILLMIIEQSAEDDFEQNDDDTEAGE